MNDHAANPKNQPVKRIALITTSYLTGGGVPTVARWLAANIHASDGYEVDIHDLACSSHDSLSRRLLQPRSWNRSSLRASDPDAQVEHWGANAVEIEPMRYLPRSELTRSLDSYDLVQVVAGSPALAAVASRSRPPTIVQAATRARWERAANWATMPLPSRAWRRLMTSMVGPVENLALRQADAVLVENASMFRYAQKLCGARAELAPPGVDTEFFSPAPNWNADGYLLSLSRLADTRKGLHRLLYAYAEMRKLEPAVPRLIIAGKGPLPSSLITLSRELSLTARVEFLVDLPASELAGLYREAAVFLQSSYEEGLGLSTIEAMACGLPTVCTATDGSREVVTPGHTGWLVPQDDEQQVVRELASHTIKILHDGGKEMSLHARARAVQNFSTERTFGRYLASYRRLVP